MDTAEQGLGDQSAQALPLRPPDSLDGTSAHSSPRLRGPARPCGNSALRAQGSEIVSAARLTGLSAQQRSVASAASPVTGRASAPLDPARTFRMPQSPAFQHDVFLSHNQADKPRVRRLAQRLRAAGLKPKAECRRQNDEILHSSFFIHPSLAVGLACPAKASRRRRKRSTVLFRDPSKAGCRFIPPLLPRDKSLTWRRKIGE